MWPIAFEILLLKIFKIYLVQHHLTLTICLWNAQYLEDHRRYETTAVDE